MQGKARNVDPIKAEELILALINHDLFVYFGHGSGMSYVNAIIASFCHFVEHLYQYLCPSYLMFNTFCSLHYMAYLKLFIMEFIPKLL
jgi:hypothetical protein